MQVNIKIVFALQVLSYGTVSPLSQGKMKQTAERYSLRIKIPFLQASGGQGSGMQEKKSDQIYLKGPVPKCSTIHFVGLLPMLMCKQNEVL